MLYYKATTGCGVMGVEHGVEALQNVQKVEAPWAAARFEGGGDPSRVACPSPSCETRDLRNLPRACSAFRALTHGCA